MKVLSEASFIEIGVTIATLWRHPPFYMKANYLSSRDNSGKTSSGSSTWHICIHVCKILRISMRPFSRHFRVKFLGVKKQQNKTILNCYWKACPQRLDEITFWYKMKVISSNYFVGKIQGNRSIRFLETLAWI